MRQAKLLTEIPADVALELAKLDPNESSTALTSGGNIVLLMLCSRQVALPADVSRDDIRTQIQNQRLSAFAEGYLAELRADAILRYP